MADEKKKIPKLPPKNKKKTNPISTPNKQTNPPKKPTTAPSKPSTPQPKPPTTSASPSAAQPNKDTPKQKPKPAQAPTKPSNPPPKSNNAPPERKPSLAPSKASTPATKSAESPAPSTVRRPSTAPRKASIPPAKAPDPAPNRKSSLASRKASTPAGKRTESTAPSPARRPSAAPRKESTPATNPTDIAQKAKPSKLPPDKKEDDKKEIDRNDDPSSAPSPATRSSVAPCKEAGSANNQTKTDQKRKPPKLGPRKTSDQSPASSQSNRPSLTPRKSSTSAAKSTVAGTNGKDAKEEDEDTPAHKVAEEEKDLKSFLSESERADLTLLIANITETMRRTIESNFDAAATLKDLSQEGQSEEDRLANIDYDPGTVDVSQYDKESKAREEREKELATPKVKELKKNALQWFDDWREVVVQRVGEAVNSKETTSKQKEKTSAQGSKPTTTPITEERPVQKVDTGAKQGDYRPPKLEQLFPRIQTPLTKLPMQKRILVLHSILLILLSLEHYNAASRVLLLYLTSSLKLGLNYLRDDEEKTAKGLLEAAKQIQADQELLKRTSEESENSRKWKIRLAQMAGAAVVGISGGMAAPMVS